MIAYIVSGSCRCEIGRSSLLAWLTGLGLVLASLHYAARCKVVPTIILGALAWTVYVVPKWLIWPVADARDNQVMLLASAIIVIGGPLVVLAANKRKQKRQL